MSVMTEQKSLIVAATQPRTISEEEANKLEAITEMRHARYALRDVEERLAGMVKDLGKYEHLLEGGDAPDITESINEIVKRLRRMRAQLAIAAEMNDA